MALLPKLAATIAILLTSAPAMACVCEGCGCKGGPGYRGPNGRCVSYRQLAKVCGSPATSRCTYEHAVQACPHEGRMPGERQSRRLQPPTRSRPVDNPFS